MLNRFLVQAVIGHPLTVHGKGGQTRAFINIEDTVRCIELAVNNPPNRGDRVKILNQVAETRSVQEVAEMVARVTGATIEHVPNPRNEAAENELEMRNATLRGLGLNPILLSEGLTTETREIAAPFKDRIDRNQILARSAWNRTRQAELDQAATKVPAAEAEPMQRRPE